MSATPQVQSNIFSIYNQFADACGKHQGKLYGSPNWDAVGLARTIVREEYEIELQEAFNRYYKSPSLENLAELADAIGDTVYVLLELSRALGVPFDRVFSAIHSANMRKVLPDGTVLKREDGKILKPEGWTPPDILRLLMDRANEEALADGTMGAENWSGFKANKDIG